MMRIRVLLLVTLMIILTTLFTTFAQDSESDLPDAKIVNEEGGAAFISGEANYTFPYFRMFLPEPYVVFYDVAGLVERDVDFVPSVESQVLGAITSDPFTSPFSYDLSLPSIPRGELRDVDNDGQKDQGVMIFSIFTASNNWADPFLERRDNFVAGVVSSIEISSDVDSFLDIIQGILIVYAPDDQQGFPSGYGDDGVLFTEDDPTVRIPAGYTVVDVSTEPFVFDRSVNATVNLIESEDAALDDFSELSYTKAFTSLIELLRSQYAFTEYKAIDWDALYKELYPRIQEAEKNQDVIAYRRVLRDLAWSIPDGHVSGPVDSDEFQSDASGGLGLVLRELDNGRVIVTDVVTDSPAAQLGIAERAEILALNGQPISEALESVVPWTSPFSTSHNLRLEQLRFVQRFPVGTQVNVTFENPDEEARTVTMTSAFDPDSFSLANLNPPLRGTELPVEFQFLNNGYGYVAVYSFSDDLPLMIHLWERMIETLNARNAPGLIIDIRQNSGGSGYLGDQLPAYFFDEPLIIGNTARYSKSRDEFVVLPDLADEFVLPEDGLYYGGPVAVIVSPSCASACESFAYAMSINDRAAIVGHFPTAGLGGSVVPVAMPDNVRFSYTNTRSLDADGNIHIEGIGVQPTVRVPLTEETVFSQRDVLLDESIAFLDTEQDRFDIVRSGLIGFDNPRQAQISSGERLHFTLNASEGQVVNISVREIGEPLDLIVRLYVPGNTEPIAQAGIGGGVPEITDVDIPFDVTVIIEVGTANDSLSGEFELTVEDVSSNE